MKLTKALAILFAMVLVVICFNAPVVFGGDEFPWDEDNDNSGDGVHGSVEDSLKYGDNAFEKLDAIGIDGTGGTSGTTLTLIRFVPYMNVVVWYSDAPAVYQELLNIIGANEKNDMVTSTNAK